MSQDMRDSDEPIGYEHMNNSRIKKEDSNKRAERLWRIISTKSQNIGRHHIILHDTPVPHCHWTNNYRDSSVISSGFTRHFSGKRKAAKAPSLPHRIQVTTNIFNFDVPSSDVPAVLPHLMASIRTPEVSPYWRWKTNEAKWFELPFVINNKVTARDFIRALSFAFSDNCYPHFMQRQFNQFSTLLLLMAAGPFTILAQRATTFDPISWANTAKSTGQHEQHPVYSRINYNV